MNLEVTRPILKFNTAHLPFTPCPAIRESYLDMFDAKAQLRGKSSKKKNDTLLIGGSVCHSTLCDLTSKFRLFAHY